MPKEKITKAGWNVTSLDKVVGNSDGLLRKAESTETSLKLISKSGVEIEVPPATVSHIELLHIKGEEMGSVFDAKPLTAILDIVADHLPDELPFFNGVAAFEIDCGERIGLEGVVSQTEMMERGVMTEWDWKWLTSAKSDVFQLNIKGNDKEKMRFVGEFNAKMTGKVKLGIRSGVIVPCFVAEKQPTSKVFMVIGKGNKGGVKYNCLWTMAPGRYMEKLPTDDRFTGRVEVECLGESITVADLLEKYKAGRVVFLGPAARSLLVDYGRAQDCWWRHGFIIASDGR